MQIKMKDRPTCIKNQLWFNSTLWYFLPLINNSMELFILWLCVGHGHFKGYDHTHIISDDTNDVKPTDINELDKILREITNCGQNKGT